MNEHKAVPNIRFKGFDDEWKNEFIKNISTMKSGGTPSVNKREYYVGDIPFIRSSDIKNESTELKINDEAIKNSSSFMVEKGTVLYALYGATSGQVSISKVTGAINQAVLAIFPNEIVNKYFLVYWLSFNKEKITNKYLQGGQGNLSAKIVKNLLLPFPTKFEQQKIGDFFTKLDKLLDLQQQKINKFDLLKKALLQKLFPKHDAKIPELRFKGYKNEWEEQKLRIYIERVSGNDGRMNLPTLTISASKGWMNQNERFSNNIAGKEQKNYTLLKRGELSYNHGNSKLFKYGVVYELVNYDEALVPKVYHSFRVNSKASARFIEYLFRGKKVDRELRKLVTSGARMDGLLNISFNNFENIQLYFPEKAEQKKVSNLLSKVDQLIELENKKLHNLQQVKKCLLQNMFVE